MPSTMRRTFLCFHEYCTNSLVLHSVWSILVLIYGILFSSAIDLIILFLSSTLLLLKFSNSRYGNPSIIYFDEVNVCDQSFGDIDIQMIECQLGNA